MQGRTSTYATRDTMSLDGTDGMARDQGKHRSQRHTNSDTRDTNIDTTTRQTRKNREMKNKNKRKLNEQVRKQIKIINKNGSGNVR